MHIVVICYIAEDDAQTRYYQCYIYITYVKMRNWTNFSYFVRKVAYFSSTIIDAQKHLFRSQNPPGSTQVAIIMYTLYMYVLCARAARSILRNAAQPLGQGS